MLTGRPGVGGFLWQEYNALNYPDYLCILTIGVVGFVLDRLMSVVERTRDSNSMRTSRKERKGRQERVELS